MKFKTKIFFKVLILSFFIFYFSNLIFVCAQTTDDTVQQHGQEDLGKDVTGVSCPAGSHVYKEENTLLGLNKGEFLGCGYAGVLTKNDSDKVTHVKCLPTNTGLRGIGVIDPDRNMYYCKVPPDQIIGKSDPCALLPAGAYDALANGKCNGRDTLLNCTNGKKKCVPAMSPPAIPAYVPTFEIPCTAIAGGTCASTTNPAGLVSRIYMFSLMIGGLVAFGALIFGAIQYILSAGSVTNKAEAKAWMIGAISGLALLLSAFIILYNINPDLVSLNNPGELDKNADYGAKKIEMKKLSEEAKNIVTPFIPGSNLGGTTTP